MTKKIIKNLKRLLTGISLITAFNSSAQDLIHNEYFNCDTTFYNGKIKEITCKNDSSGFKYIDLFNEKEELNSETLLYGDEIKMTKKFRKNKNGTLLEWDINGDGTIDKVLLYDLRQNIVMEDKDDDYHFDSTISSDPSKSSFKPFSTRQKELQMSNQEKEKSKYAQEKIDSLENITNKKIKSLVSKFEENINEINKEHKNQIDSLKKFYENEITEMKNNKKNSEKQNTYQGNLENILIAYVSLSENRKTAKLNVDSLQQYNMSIKGSLMGFFMGAETGSFDPGIRLYVVEKNKENFYVMPVITETGYDFREDSPKKISKEIKEIFPNQKSIKLLEPQEYGSRKMFFELINPEEKP